MIHVRFRALALALLVPLAGSCTVGPDYEQPALAVPPAWREEPGTAFVSQEGSQPGEISKWWRCFADPTLDRLIDRAVHEGLDVREAIARVVEARALRGVAGADYFPTVDAVLSYERRGESENTAFDFSSPDNNLYKVGFDAAWEIDLWGRIRRSVEAAEADLAASVEDARGVAVTVAAETAINYVELRSFQKRLAIALNNVALQDQTLALVRARFAAGLVGERDLAQALTNVESTRSHVPQFEMALRAAENRLAVLLGLSPGALAAELAEVAPIPTPPIQVAVGVPADLLRRRPDVRRAERVLAAETARIGIAEGDLYPRLTLIGRFGLESEKLTDLFEADSAAFSIGPSIRWNIFDGGRLRSLVAAQDARAEQALVRWERTVLTALEESENGMTAFLREQTRRHSLSEASTHARRAVELAQSQYRSGISDFQTVLDSERALADLEDQLAESDAAIASNVIVLYKSLGGGWGWRAEKAPE